MRVGAHAPTVVSGLRRKPLDVLPAEAPLVAPGDSVTPGHFNQEGNPRGGHSLLAGQYGEGSVAFFALLHQWREDGRLAGLAIL